MIDATSSWNLSSWWCARGLGKYRLIIFRSWPNSMTDDLITTGRDNLQGWILERFLSTCNSIRNIFWPFTSPSFFLSRRDQDRFLLLIPELCSTNYVIKQRHPVSSSSWPHSWSILPETSLYIGSHVLVYHQQRLYGCPSFRECYSGGDWFARWLTMTRTVKIRVGVPTSPLYYWNIVLPRFVVIPLLIAASSHTESRLQWFSQSKMKDRVRRVGRMI